jgi:hypothetical protein
VRRVNLALGPAKHAVYGFQTGGARQYAERAAAIGVAPVVVTNTRNAPLWV